VAGQLTEWRSRVNLWLEPRGPRLRGSATDKRIVDRIPKGGSGTPARLYTDPTIAFHKRGLQHLWHEKPSRAGENLHQHPYPEWHVINAGQYECQIGDEVRILGPGGAMFRPGGTIDGIKNRGSDFGQLMGIISSAGVFEAFITEAVQAQVDRENRSRASSLRPRVIAAKYGIEFI